MSWINYLKTAIKIKTPDTRRHDQSLRGFFFDKSKVDPDNALELSDVLTCVRVLAESVACLPLCLYRREQSGGFKDYDHPVFDLLRYSPNPEMTSYELRLHMMTDALIRGNGCAQIIRSASGVPLSIYPLYSHKLGFEYTPKGDLVYSYPDPDQKDEKIYLKEEEVLLIKTFGTGSLLSPSLIEMSSDLMTGAKGAEEYTREFFANGTVVSGVIEYPQTMDDEQFSRLKQSWSESYSGSGNRHRVPVLEGGAAFKPLQISHTETQMLESRKYTRSQIAGLFRVPAHLINDLEKATFSNIEHQDLGFVKHTLRPWLCNWEQRLRLSLLTEGEKSSYYFKHDLNDMLRGDLPSRFTAYSQAIQNGILSPNDVRRLEDLPQVDGLDVYYANGALQPIGQPGEVEENAEAIFPGLDAFNETKSDKVTKKEILNKSYSDYPQAATNNAKRALKYVAEHGWGSCGTDVGKQRASQIANREPLSRDTIARMSAFKRHQQNKDVPYGDGCGGLMWDCWGGSAGINWANKKLKEIDGE